MNYFFLKNVKILRNKLTTFNASISLRSSIRKRPLARSVSVHFQALTGNWNTSLVENWNSVWPHAFAGWCCKSNVINFYALGYSIPNLWKIDILVSCTISHQNGVIFIRGAVKKICKCDVGVTNCEKTLVMWGGALVTWNF